MFSILLAEQAKQLAMVDVKMIFSLVDNSETILEVCSLLKISSIPVVSVKVDQRQSISNGVIDFSDLVKPAGKTLHVYLYWFGFRKPK